MGWGSSDLAPILHLIEKGLPVLWDEASGNAATPSRAIIVRNCPLVSPPPDVVKQGNRAILSYFAERKKQQFKNTEIKLILVGNSTAGKTSLSRFLRERAYQSGEPTTHGIRNNRWEPEEAGVQVNIWDFGGQEYYHATHRLFLSRNAVYALVWDVDTNKGGVYKTRLHYANDPRPTTIKLEHFPLKWWLRNIRHYTRESDPPVPIMLVQNKCAKDGINNASQQFGGPPFNLPLEWSENRLDLEAAADPTHPKHNMWHSQFEAFEERLLDNLKSHLAHYEFAVYHRDIHDEVRRLASGGVTDMPYSDFEALCRRFDPDANMDLVQIYLRDITGDILYYPENERLKARVFLNPNWVCDSIYQILSREVQANAGVFDTKWVQQALQCDEAHALDFVALLREFELVFDDTDESGLPTGQFVAPQYLPDNCAKPDKLEAVKEYANLQHAFTIWFPEFLPKSHIARFVARWGSNAEDRLFWKNGLLFKTDGCTALVERMEETRIRVDISANQPKRLDAIQRIFQSFLNLEDGQATFAISLDEHHFVLWRDILEAINSEAKQVKIFPYTEPIAFVALKPFLIFRQPLSASSKRVFIWHSETDESHLKQLKKQLSPLRQQSLLETWDKTELLAGAHPENVIRQQLNTADIIIFLVSADFLENDYDVWNDEIKEAIERHKRDEVTVVLVIVSSCLWQDTQFGKLQALPEKGKPISTWENLDEAWTHVVEEIKQVINL